ncbi:MAG: tetratricopeptide repeat protein [Bacteroidota bacterium]
MSKYLLLLFLLLCGFSSSGQIPDTIENLKEQLESTSKNSTKYVDLLNDLGYQHWVLDSQISIIYGNQSLTIAKDLKYSLGIAKAHRILGVANWTLGKPKEALENLALSQQHYSNLGNQEGATDALMNSGMVYADIGEYDKALDIFHTSIDRFSQLDLKKRVATTFTKIGAVYLEQKDYNKAKKHLTDALNIHRDLDYAYGQGEAHNRLGRMYLDTDEIELATYHLGRAKALSESINDQDGILSTDIQFGRLCRLKQDFEMSERVLNNCYDKAKARNLDKYRLIILRELKLLKKETGHLNEALELYNRFILLKDSLFNTTKSKQIAALEFENERAQQNQQIELLQKDKKVSELTNLTLSVALFAIGLIGLLIFRQQKSKNNRSKEVVRQQQQLLESQQLLNQQSLENAKLKEQELIRELEFKNKELTSYTLNFVQKNQLLAALKNQIEALESDTAGFEQRKTQLLRILRQNINLEKDWEDFKRFFQEVHLDFFHNLKDKHPELNANDLKIASLVRLNLNIKESATILGISPESAKTARYRLRKKMGLEHDTVLLDYFLQMET